MTRPMGILHQIPMTGSAKGENCMRRKVILVAAVVFLFGLGVGGHTWGQGIYKWVDEKGTIHFSDGSAPVPQKSLETSPDRNQLNSPDKNQGKGASRQAVQEDSQAVLKRYEFGKRDLPNQTLKYGSGRSAGTHQGTGKAASAAPPKGRP
jgi:Domain of unknown function (DUF4124)